MGPTPSGYKLGKAGALIPQLGGKGITEGSEGDFFIDGRYVEYEPRSAKPFAHHFFELFQCYRIDVRLPLQILVTAIIRVDLRLRMGTEVEAGCDTTDLFAAGYWQRVRSIGEDEVKLRKADASLGTL